MASARESLAIRPRQSSIGHSYSIGVRGDCRNFRGPSGGLSWTFYTIAFAVIVGCNRAGLTFFYRFHSSRFRLSSFFRLTRLFLRPRYPALARLLWPSLRPRNRQAGLHRRRARSLDFVVATGIHPDPADRSFLFPVDVVAGLGCGLYLEPAEENDRFFLSLSHARPEFIPSLVTDS